MDLELYNDCTTASETNEKGDGWRWTETEQNVFDTLKKNLTSSDVMAYYKQNAVTKLIVDASPLGSGAFLQQKQFDGKYRVVANASRALTPTERRYSQKEREG